MGVEKTYGGIWLRETKNGVWRGRGGLFSSAGSHGETLGRGWDKRAGGGRAEELHSEGKYPQQTIGQHFIKRQQTVE